MLCLKELQRVFSLEGVQRRHNLAASKRSLDGIEGNITLDSAFATSRLRFCCGLVSKNDVEDLA